MSGPWLIPVLPNIPGKTTCAQCERLDRLSMLKMLAARSDRIMSPPLAQNPPDLKDAIGNVTHPTKPYGAFWHPTFMSCSSLFLGVKGGHTCLLGTSVSEVLQQCACTRRGSLHVSPRMITPLWCTNFDTWFRTTSACVAITHYSCGSIEGPTLPIQDWDPSTQQ